jgi:peptide/nickel transport system ATP-binding protein
MSEPVAIPAIVSTRVGKAGFAIGLAIVAVIAAAALFGNALIPQDPFVQDLGNRLKPPFWMEGTQAEHPLGTDQLGRDYLARLVYGARISLLIGIMTVITSGLIGITLGVLGGFFGGRVDDVVLFCITTRLSIPVVLVALAVVGLMGSSLTLVVLTLGLLLWDRFAVVARQCRLVRRRLDLACPDKGDPAEHRESPGRGGDARNGAGHSAGGCSVVPRARGAAAASLLGPDDRRGQGLHVLLRLGDHDPRRGARRAGARHQSGGRRLAQPARHGADAMSAILEIEDLAVTFGGRTAAVRGASFTVEKGETHCLVGESGCGKSVTALAVMSLLARGGHRTAKRLSFAGTDLLGLSDREMARIRGNRMAMIFQEPMTSLNPAFTVGSQMAEVLTRHKGASRAAALERAVELMGRVGITAPDMRLGQFPHQLSGGLRQRVMIAMALMCEPDLLVADEPTTALDVTVQAQILRLLASLKRDFGLAILLITHDLGIVARVADRATVRRATPPLYARAVVLRAGTRQGAARPAARLDSGRGADHHAGLCGLRVPLALRPCGRDLRRGDPAPAGRRRA